MKRPQIRLRLLMLLVALLASYFSYVGAIRTRTLADHEIERMNLQTELASQRSGLIELYDLFDNANSQSLRRSVGGHIPRVKARIVEIEGELERLGP